MIVRDVGGKNNDDLEAATKLDGGGADDGGDEQFEIGGNLDQSDDYEDFLNGGGGK